MDSRFRGNDRHKRRLLVTPLSMLVYAPEYVSSIRGVLLKGLLGERGGPWVEPKPDSLFRGNDKWRIRADDRLGR
jgi:hypothetical protein